MILIISNFKMIIPKNQYFILYYQKVQDLNFPIYSEIKKSLLDIIY